jgi:hypothetical protein
MLSLCNTYIPNYNGGDNIAKDNEETRRINVPGRVGGFLFVSFKISIRLKSAMYIGSRG